MMDSGSSRKSDEYFGRRNEERKMLRCFTIGRFNSAVAFTVFQSRTQNLNRSQESYRNGKQWKSANWKCVCVDLFTVLILNGRMNDPKKFKFSNISPNDRIWSLTYINSLFVLECTILLI